MSTALAGLVVTALLSSAAFSDEPSDNAALLTPLEGAQQGDAPSRLSDLIDAKATLEPPGDRIFASNIHSRPPGEATADDDDGPGPIADDDDGVKGPRANDKQRRRRRKVWEALWDWRQPRERL